MTSPLGDVGLLNISFVLAGFVAGISFSILFKIVRFQSARQIAEELYRESEASKSEHLNEVIETVKASFGALALDALSKVGNVERELTVQDLENRKNLIDQQLEKMDRHLTDVTALVHGFGKDSHEKFGALTTELTNTKNCTTTLSETVNKLREVLANSKARGSLGEYMAEDVLRMAGFKEPISYTKQKAIGDVGSIPDFTFILPKNLKLNMDVKFPYTNYQKFIEAASETEKERFKSDFFRDVRAKIKEVTTREYINPEQNTVDCVILFIPIESIYSFIWEEEPSILDLGLKNRVIFCSPITLLAVLAVIRQAVDHFSLQETSNEILRLLGTFKAEWVKFLRKLDMLGKRIDAAQREYQELATTRKNQLERPLVKMDRLRQEKGLPVLEVDAVSDLMEEEKPVELTQPVV